jgi:hypothetical protein
MANDDKTGNFLIKALKSIPVIDFGPAFRHEPGGLEWQLLRPKRRQAEQSGRDPPTCNCQEPRLHNWGAYCLAPVTLATGRALC